MDKQPLSRVAKEAEEVDRRASDVKEQISELSQQLTKAQRFIKHDERTESAIERFRRYFAINGVPVEKRKPTRAEMRAQRTRALVWATAALILLFFVLSRLLSLLLH